MSAHTAPAYSVTIGSRSFTQPASDGLEQLVLEDHVDMVSYLALRLSGGEGQPRWEVQLGDTVEVKLGAGEVVLFTGEVTALEPAWTEGGSYLTVRALDNTHRLARGRKTRWFKDKKDSDIVNSVGGESNLPVETDPTPETHAYTLQRNESDLAFLRRLAARNNFKLSVEQGKLLFKKADFHGTGATLTMGTDIKSCRMQFNSQDQVSKVVVRGWDIRKKEEIVGTATPGDVETIGSGEVGASLASSKFGEHVAYITDVPVASQSEATALAKAEMNRLARQFCQGTVLAEGNDQLRAGATVTLAGLNEGSNGTFFIVASRHVISTQSGYTTEVSFVSNTKGS
jgi:phage protein D